MTKTQLIQNCVNIAKPVVPALENATVQFAFGTGFWIDLHDGNERRFYFRKTAQALQFIAKSIEGRRIVASWARH